MRAWVVCSLVAASSGLALADGPVAEWTTVEVVDASHIVNRKAVFAALESTQKAMNECIQAGQHTSALAWLVVGKDGAIGEAKVESDPAAATECVTKVFRAMKLSPAPSDHATVFVKMELSGLKEGQGYDPKPLPPPDLPPWSTGNVSVKFDKVVVKSGALTAEEAERVVRSRTGVFKACYQKELNRTPNIAGVGTVRFATDDDGAVRSVAIASKWNNADVDNCIAANVKRLHFPAKNKADASFVITLTN